MGPQWNILAGWRMFVTFNPSPIITKYVGMSEDVCVYNLISRVAYQFLSVYFIVFLTNLWWEVIRTLSSCCIKHWPMPYKIYHTKPSGMLELLWKSDHSRLRAVVKHFWLLAQVKNFRVAGLQTILSVGALSCLLHKCSQNLPMLCHLLSPEAMWGEFSISSLCCQGGQKEQGASANGPYHRFHHEHTSMHISVCFLWAFTMLK